MSSTKWYVATVLLLAFSVPAGAQDEPKKIVVGTLPTLSAIAKEIGGAKLAVVSLARPDEDPHFVSPTPYLMNKVRMAELLLEIGMLQDRWADRVADGSGNTRITRGARGRITTSVGIPKSG